MTIPGLDPSGELGRLFFQIQSKSSHEKDVRQSPGGGHRGTTDAVDLSRLAQDIRTHATRAAELPDLRTDRIQHIQQALAQGIELATPGQVADAITRETILNALGS
ncbi:MAG: flagellar biosynthesis anti-sigma factor FlgM [Nitrospirota bacterium]|nr:flagellar biosynthesis anti-sigma factor FlgM [Nitrospirota bacterium]MDH5775765.1 flagellar biosynthesis anti-sigma factor FlgM [Nitrospirota bacterium]